MALYTITVLLMQLIMLISMKKLHQPLSTFISTPNNLTNVPQESPTINTDATSDSPSFKGFGTSPVSSSQDTPTFATNSTHLHNNHPHIDSAFDSPIDTTSPLTNSADSFVPCSISSSQSPTNKLIEMPSTTQSNSDCSLHLSKNRFAVLNSNSWGDEEHEAPIENWETIADSEYLAVPNHQMKCIMLEQDKDPVDHPTPTSTQHKLHESDYLPVNTPLSTKQKRKLAQIREKERIELQ